MTSNQLGLETSPYLLQHKDNPVHWRAWGTAVLDEARALDKPILLSVGYAACHWCHVMAHESFENPAIAALMNELFVPIKVDREERPDVDAIYMQALSILGQQGGWPLTMFLTPDAKPFWGGTYFPPEAKWGRAGFPDILRNVARVYRTQRDKVDQNVAALTAGLEKLSAPRPGDLPDSGILDPIAARLMENLDAVDGGISGAPKFPNPSILALLWRGYRRTDQRALRDGVLTALDHMSQGGIYDHLGGGYARYSTDARWLVPHFEKMLYDNAQLVELLTWAWQDTRAPLYRERVTETVGWLEREMMGASGGFAATLDADSEHVEGKFYVWTEAEIDALLGPDGAVFKAFYDVTPHGNWEEHTILNRLHRPARADDETEALLTRCRQVLFAAREPRIHPGRDHKILADWNGLMIAALARASQAFDQPAWLDLAAGAWAFVTGTMNVAGDRLHHSWCEGRTHPGTLDDYANMSRAGLALHEATGDGAYLAQVQRWIAVVEARFADTAGGYFFTADDTESLIVRTKSVNDNAVPAGNGVLVEVLGRLFLLTGEDRYATAAEHLIAAFSGETERNFFPLATYLNGLDFLANAVQVTVIGEPDEARVLLRAVHETCVPNLVLTMVTPQQSLPAHHPAAGKDIVSGQATAYVCRGRTCSLPVTGPAQLIPLLIPQTIH